MKLVLIRHGESEWNRLNLFTGWTDVPLTPRGESEAQEGGRVLQEAGFDFDLCYNSFLKRAIRTLNFVLQALDREWLPVHKSWKLNERHYGDLQGLNKTETAQKYGEQQVRVWRRSFDVAPPPLTVGDARCPHTQASYRGVCASGRTPVLPFTESLKDTVARVVPYFEEEIKPQMISGQRVLIVAHGNSLRALMKHIESLDETQIMEVNLPTGVPLVYEFEADFTLCGKRFLGNEADVAARAQAVADQGKSN